MLTLIQCFQYKMYYLFHKAGLTWLNGGGSQVQRTRKSPIIFPFLFQLP